MIHHDKTENTYELSGDVLNEALYFKKILKAGPLQDTQILERKKIDDLLKNKTQSPYYNQSDIIPLLPLMKKEDIRALNLSPELFQSVPKNTTKSKEDHLYDSIKLLKKYYFGRYAKYKIYTKSDRKPDLIDRETFTIIAIIFFALSETVSNVLELTLPSKHTISFTELITYDAIAGVGSLLLSGLCILISIPEEKKSTVKQKRPSKASGRLILITVLTPITQAFLATMNTNHHSPKHHNNHDTAIHQ